MRTVKSFCINFPELIQNLEKEEQIDSRTAILGRIVYAIGWVIFPASILFALFIMSGDHPRILFLFWLSFSIFCFVSVAYIMLRAVSEKWRLKVIRAYVSPYIIGSTIWLILVLLFLAGKS